MTIDKITIGILAHVDAGKTTLSEGLLFLGGAIRRQGRVDNKDTFLDTDQMERDHGITIYSKQAVFKTEPILPDGRKGERTYTLLDTPGHADFSAEMERTLQVLDYAVLVVSAPDSVTGQVRTLWKLLDHYRVPVLVFVNKMDQLVPAEDLKGDGGGRWLPAWGSDVRKRLLDDLSRDLGGHFADFTQDTDSEEVQEEISLCREDLMEQFLEGETISDAQIRDLVRDRALVPVLFGSALKMLGVEDLIHAMDRFFVMPAYPDDFGARVFKITRDEKGDRLTWMKITGGSLRVKTLLTLERDGESLQEKADQIRIYSGTRFRPAQEAKAGDVCAVTGLTATFAGQSLGFETGAVEGLLQPVLACQILLPPGEDKFKAYKDLCLLEEEDPVLHILYDETKKEITAQVMGEMQREVLKQRAFDRFHLAISFGQPSIVYKETIVTAAEGVGHFEPLRHYAEVHLLLEPGEPGSGLVFESRCSVNVLARNWQRLVLTHLRERRHRGVLTGSEITDMKISLIGGRSHEKHTEGGDFRQATYRAVRQGLMMARSALLEPYYSFRLEVPGDVLGHALTDLQRMGASFGQPDFEGTRAVLEGTVPVSAMGEYAANLRAYTRGEGVLTCSLLGYGPCHNEEEVIEAIGYDPEEDIRNPSSSVFCAHGAGVIIPWYEVRDYMQTDTGWREEETEPAPEEATMDGGISPLTGRRVRVKDERSFKERQAAISAGEDELRAIFERTYGPIRSRTGEEAAGPRVIGEAAPPPRYRKPRPRPEKEYLLVDGYNIIYAWEDLRDLAERDLKAARDRLMDILSNFAGSRAEQVILVFDAYRVAGGQSRVYRYHNIDVVFTREAETADLYIEKTTHELVRQYKVTVATSDAVEQVIIFGAGAFRMSAAMLREEVERTSHRLRMDYLDTPEPGRRYLLDGISEEVRKQIEGTIEDNED